MLQLLRGSVNKILNLQVWKKVQQADRTI